VHPAICCQDCTVYLIETKIGRAFNSKQFSKFETRAMSATLDCSHRAPADFCHLFATNAGGAYQDQCFALVVGQSGECQSEFLKFDVTVLLGECFKAFRIVTIAIFDLPPTLATPGPKGIVEDREYMQSNWSPAEMTEYWRGRALTCPGRDRRRDRGCLTGRRQKRANLVWLPRYRHGRRNNHHYCAKAGYSSALSRSYAFK
jgi:hypothetical protein